MVSTVDTNKPPIMVAAIPANMASPNNGSIPRIVVPEAMVTGNDTCLGSLDHGRHSPLSILQLKSDFIDQHNGILDIHTNQSQQTEDGKEVQ